MQKIRKKFGSKVIKMENKGNLCLQGKRDPVAGKVANANQTYIGGGG